MSSNYVKLENDSQLGNKQVMSAGNGMPPMDTEGKDCGCEYKEVPGPGSTGPGVGSAKRLSGEWTMPQRMGGGPV